MAGDWLAAIDAGLPPKTSLADRSLPSSLEISNGDLNHKMALKVEGAEAGYGQNKVMRRMKNVKRLMTLNSGEISNVSFPVGWLCALFTFESNQLLG